MAGQLVGWITGVLSGLPKELVCFIISMLPILELRGGMIAAALFDLAWVKALVICIIGNIIPIPFLLLFITRIFTWLKKIRRVRPVIERLERRAMNKSGRIQAAEFVGLVFFVGIPLPGTGAWTGSLIASLLGVKISKAIPAELLGVLLAAAIMSVVTYVIPWLITLI